MKKILSVITALVLSISIVAGCGSTKESESTKENGSSQTVSQSTADAKKEPVTITWMVIDVGGPAPLKNDLSVIKELSKRTNVIIDFQLVPATNYNDKYNLVVSSGDMPDLIYNDVANLNKGGLDGAFVAIDDIISKDAPNYKKFIESDPNYPRMMKASNGKMYAFVKWTFLNTTCANFIRRDWLTNVGISKVPETLDEMEAALIAFRDNDPNKNSEKDEIPYSNRDGYNGILSTFGDPFEIAFNLPFTVDKDKLVFSWIDQRYKEGLQYLNKLYKDGLVDREFMPPDGKIYEAKLSANRIGSTNYWIGSTLSQNDKMGDTIPGFEWVGVPPLKGPGGNKMFNGGENLSLTNCTAITISNKHVAETAKLIDYMFSPEGKELMNWGIKDVHYNVSDGKNQFTDLIMNNPKFPVKTDALNSEGLYISLLPFVYDEDWWWQVSPGAEEKRVRSMYASSLGPNVPSMLPISQEDKDATDRIITDATTYRDEMTVKFIMGTEPIEKFDDYVANMKKIGVDKVIDVYNKAYQEYLKK